jgi:hypothetical protein
MVRAMVERESDCQHHTVYDTNAKRAIRHNGRVLPFAQANNSHATERRTETERKTPSANREHVSNKKTKDVV